MKVKSIKWGEEKIPNNEISYNHCIGESPIGRFLITWKGWKESPSFDVEDSPFGWIGSEDDLDGAKNIAQEEFNNMIIDCLELYT